jgi:hypothetical protein
MHHAARSPKQVDVLVADIGSTLTKLSAFTGVRNASSVPPRQALSFVDQGMALTTIAEGDVLLGLEAARKDLQARFGIETSGAILMAASSAAGGLRMTVV